MDLNLPNFLIDILNNQYEKEIVDKIIKGYSSKRKVTLRANTIKTTVENIEKILE